MRQSKLFSRLFCSFMLAGTLALAGCATSSNQLSSSTQLRSYPPPALFQWSAAAAAGSATPQQAFATGMRLDYCQRQHVAARSVTTTWLASGPNVGVVWVVATCQDATDPRPWQSLFLVRRDLRGGPTSDQWISGDVGFSQKPAGGPIPTEVQAQVPPWLSLPPDAYRQMPTETNSHPLVTVQCWTSATHVFISGHFEGTATHPPTGATTVTVSGRLGWLLEDYGVVTVNGQPGSADGLGMTSVIVPLSGPAGEETFFFSGTTTPQEAQMLAGQLLSHLDQELPLTPSPAPSPSGG